MDVVSQHAFLSIHAVNDFNQHSHVQCSRPRMAFTSQSVHLKPLLTFDHMFQCPIFRSRSAGCQPLEPIRVMRIWKCTCAAIVVVLPADTSNEKHASVDALIIPYAISKESKDRCNSI
jgi:hypothetical protein